LTFSALKYKTESILRFGKSNYLSVVYVNFVLQPAFRSIVGAGYDVENVVRQMTLVDAGLKFIPGATLVVFDEIQAAPDVMTTLKSFKIDGRYDVIASGSLLGVHYRQVASFATGYEEELEMHSMDFEEFLLARGRDSHFVDSLFQQMLSCRPLGELERKVWDELFLEFCVVGGMPAAVRAFVTQGNYQGVVKIQRDILKLYRQDARRYCEGLDSARILDVYDSVPAQLAKEYKKFQYSGVRKGSSARDYAGCLRWLEDAGLIVRAFCMHQPELPIKGNVDTGVFKVYFPDTGLLLASLDEEAALDFKVNRNFHTYKGGIAENIVAESIVKSGKPLGYFKRENSTLIFSRGARPPPRATGPTKTGAECQTPRASLKGQNPGRVGVPSPTATEEPDHPNRGPACHDEARKSEVGQRTQSCVFDFVRKPPIFNGRSRICRTRYACNPRVACSLFVFFTGVWRCLALYTDLMARLPVASGERAS